MQGCELCCGCGCEVCDCDALCEEPHWPHCAQGANVGVMVPYKCQQWTGTWFGYADTVIEPTTASFERVLTFCRSFHFLSMLYMHMHLCLWFVPFLQQEHMRVLKHTHTHTQTHTHTHIISHTHIHNRTHAHVHTHTLIHAHSRAQPQPNTGRYTTGIWTKHRHTHTHTH